MNQTWLISGPPGCGKTTWILKMLQQHAGPCSYLRLSGHSLDNLELGRNAGIDRAWLHDQIPQLNDLSKNDHNPADGDNNHLALIELRNLCPEIVLALREKAPLAPRDRP